MNNIAIFASGAGSNAENISNFFLNHSKIQTSCILTNKPDAYVIERALRLKIPCYVFSRDDLYDNDSAEILRILSQHGITHIVLAGFLWKVPKSLLHAFPNHIINIHPALLPEFGGKGMYGIKVHQAVLERGVSCSGITIHLVNEEYDNGSLLFQTTCSIEPNETPDSLAEKVHQLEYLHYPAIIEKWILQQ